MATVEENVAKIEKQISDATSAARSVRNFTFEGRSYNPTQIIQDLLPSLNNRLNNAKKQREAVGKKTKAEQNLQARQSRATRTILDRINKAIRIGENSLNDTFEAFQNGRISQADYSVYLESLDKLRADKAAIENGAVVTPTGKPGGSGPRDVAVSYEVVKPQAPPKPVTAPVDPK